MYISACNLHDQCTYLREIHSTKSLRQHSLESSVKVRFPTEESKEEAPTLTNAQILMANSPLEFLLLELSHHYHNHRISTVDA